MAFVTIRENESQEAFIKRFQEKVQPDGILRELKSHRYFVSKAEVSRTKIRKYSRRKGRNGK